MAGLLFCVGALSFTTQSQNLDLEEVGATQSLYSINTVKFAPTNTRLHGPFTVIETLFREDNLFELYWSWVYWGPHKSNFEKLTKFLTTEYAKMFPDLILKQGDKQVRVPDSVDATFFLPCHYRDEVQSQYLNYDQWCDGKKIRKQTGLKAPDQKRAYATFSWYEQKSTMMSPPVIEGQKKGAQTVLFMDLLFQAFDFKQDGLDGKVSTKLDPRGAHKVLFLAVKNVFLDPNVRPLVKVFKEFLLKHHQSCAQVADLNKDGSIDRSEFADYLMAMRWVSYNKCDDLDSCSMTDDDMNQDLVNANNNLASPEDVQNYHSLSFFIRGEVDGVRTAEEKQAKILGTTSFMKIYPKFFWLPDLSVHCISPCVLFDTRSKKFTSRPVAIQTHMVPFESVFDLSSDDDKDEIGDVTKSGVTKALEVNPIRPLAEVFPVAV